MVKSGYRYITETFQKHDTSYQSSGWNRLVELRHSPSIYRVPHPTNIARARELGYKAKQGYIIVRSKIRKGSMHKLRPRAGRTNRNLGVNQITTKKSLQRMAEERAAKKYTNCEVLNSYLLTEDGRSKWYEVIMVDVNHPRIITDSKINWIGTSANKRRVFRALTSAGKRGKGLENRGIGAEKLRPSLKANKNRGK